MNVYVVTGLELGWDCVCDVLPGHFDLEQIKKAWPEGEYVITKIDMSTQRDLDLMVEEREEDFD